MQQNEPTFYTGLKIDNFRLLSHIGSGGTAEVWEVEDPNLNKWAMKIFSPTRGMDESAIRLFKLEFKNTEKLIHPNILRARKYGEYENRPYMIFDLCDSSLMKILMDRMHASKILNLSNPSYFSEELLAGVINQVAGALEYLHAKGMVHQDIKPDNILVKTGFNDENTYMISDFGVSTDIKMTILRDSQVLTDSNKGLTPDYASPELYQGDPIPATDIFALGITLYELCTGRPPVSNTSMTTAIALLNNIPVKTDLPGEYTQRFKMLIKKCIELHPDERPTASDLIRWTSFYQREQYWPDEMDNQDLNPPPAITGTFRDNLKKYGKPISIILVSVAIIWVLSGLIIPQFFDHEKSMLKALKQADFDKAALYYDKLDEDKKMKWNHLNNLAELQVSAMYTGKNFSYLVIKNKNSGKLGLLDMQGNMVMESEYDQILKIYDPKIVTVKKNGICGQYNIRTSNLNASGSCKVYRSYEDYLIGN